MSASWSLGDGRPCLCCFVEIQWLQVNRIGVCGYGYIRGYPRKNMWIWVWIWMGNFISTASLEKTRTPAICLNNPTKIGPETSVIHGDLVLLNKQHIHLKEL